MKDFYSTGEAAKILGMSRVAVLKKIKTGKLQATRIGKNYAIPAHGLLPENGSGYSKNNSEALTNAEKSSLDHAVEKTIREYGETLKLLQDH